MTNLLADARSLSTPLTELRRQLHRHAEVGFDLHNTLTILHTALKGAGVNPKPCGRGLMAEVGQGPRVVLLRADADALPITEETDLPFRCTHGAMHACGHDLHAAMVLGAATLLKKQEKELNGRVRFYFQPAEELLEGAREGVEQGILEDVEAAYMLHVLPHSPAGRVVLPPEGICAPGADFFEIILQGNACHGASPHKGIDPICAGAHLLTALNTLPAREFPPRVKGALTVGEFHGGNAPNAIPSEAVLRGSLRCFDDGFREQIKRRLGEMVQATERAFRVKGALRFTAGCPCLRNDGTLRREAETILSNLLPKDGFFAADARSDEGGSEDFAVISQRVPSLMVGIFGAPEGDRTPLHHPKIRFDEKILPIGSAVLAALAIQHLEQ